MAYSRDEAAFAFGFLREIAANNNREWFASHRADYDRALRCFQDFSQDMILALSRFDSSVTYLSAKDCIYRFYRDIRFSEDKSPYKRHFGCYVNSHGKKSLHGGYYIHWQPENSFIAAGCWGLPFEIMDKVRRSIRDNLEEYVSIVDSPEFSAMFPSVGQESFKAVPRGFRKDEPCAEYIMPKDFVVMKALDDSLFAKDDPVSRIAEAFRIAKPFMDFVNDTVDDYIS